MLIGRATLRHLAGCAVNPTVCAFDQPLLRLAVEPPEIANIAADEESFALMHHTFHAALGFGPPRPACFGNELVRDSELVVRGVPDHGLTRARGNGGFEVVEEYFVGDAAEKCERAAVAI